jgi:hypothetical protein
MSRVMTSKGFGEPIASSKSHRTGRKLPMAVDAETVPQQWLNQFRELDDPRGTQGVEHPFLSIVMIAILATIAGATGWEDIETYAESHESWLGTNRHYPMGFPMLTPTDGCLNGLSRSSLSAAFSAGLSSLWKTQELM